MSGFSCGAGVKFRLPCLCGSHFSEPATSPASLVLLTVCPEYIRRVRLLVKSRRGPSELSGSICLSVVSEMVGSILVSRFSMLFLLFFWNTHNAKVCSLNGFIYLSKTSFILCNLYFFFLKDVSGLFQSICL